MMNKMEFKPSLPLTRGWLNFATAVEIVAVLQLYFFSTSTDKYFAWTISVPLTAAFLGMIPAAAAAMTTTTAMAMARRGLVFFGMSLGRLAWWFEPLAA